MDATSEATAAVLNRGVRSLADGLLDTARSEFARVLQILQDAPDPVTKAMALYNLGVVESLAGNADQARGYFVQAVSEARQIDFGLVQGLAGPLLEDE